jgi:cytidyltransferase-like protein
MKAYQLTESSMPQTVAIIFGRFNPPHKGHKHAWETAAQVADQWYVGTNKSTVGPEDPLPFEVKIEAMKAIMPEVEEHLVAEQSWWTLATYVFKKYGGVPGRTLPFDLVVITDEPYVVPGLLKSNGQSAQHGEYSFQNIRLPFENIEQAKKHLRISSATALRNAVAAGDRDAFSAAAGVDADTPVAGHKFFDLVAHYLMPHREAQAAKDAAKAEKEKQKAEKLAMKQQKTKGPAQELVESGICWKGYKRKPGTKKYSPGSCVKDSGVGEEFSTTIGAVGDAVKNAANKVGDTLATALPQDMRPFDHQTAAKFSKNVSKPKQVNEKSTTEKQARFMAAAAHNPKFAAKAGIKQSVAKEFNKADTGTTQLSQAMKNKPKKRLSEELETVYENRHGSIQDDVSASLPATYVFPKLQNQDAYSQYRFGLAIADVRGRKAREGDAGNQKFQATSPWGENEVIVSFDPNIDKVLDAALVSVGQTSADKKLITTPKSEETKDVSKNSPVANIKRNKYGI